VTFNVGLYTKSDRPMTSAPTLVESRYATQSIVGTFKENGSCGLADSSG
jgi:hypothetical protein